MTGHTAVTWSDLAIDGAFMLGLVTGAFIVVHLTRSIAEHIRRDDRTARRRGDDE